MTFKKEKKKKNHKMKILKFILIKNWKPITVKVS